MKFLVIGYDGKPRTHWDGVTELKLSVSELIDEATDPDPYSFPGQLESLQEKVGKLTEVVALLLERLMTEQELCDFFCQRISSAKEIMRAE